MSTATFYHHPTSNKVMDPTQSRTGPMVLSEPSSIIKPTRICCQRRNSLPRMSSSHKNNLGYRKQYCSGSDQISGTSSTTTTSTVSLHYISQYLTPDTLILPQKFLQAAAAANHCANQPYLNPMFCDHHPHLYHHFEQQQHRIHLDMAMMVRQNNNSNNNGNADSVVNAATAQLEEIIRLCRTLQWKNSNLTNDNIGGGNAVGGASLLLSSPSYPKSYHNRHCCCTNISTAAAKCRYSADCIQYFLQNEQFQNGSTETSTLKTTIDSSMVSTTPKTTTSVHQHLNNDDGKDFLVVHEGNTKKAKTTTSDAIIENQVKAVQDKNNTKSNNNNNKMFNVSTINHNPHEQQRYPNNNNSESMMIAIDGDDLRLINNDDDNGEEAGAKCQVLIGDGQNEDDCCFITNNIMEIEAKETNNYGNKNNMNTTLNSNKPIATSNWRTDSAAAVSSSEATDTKSTPPFAHQQQKQNFDDDRGGCRIKREDHHDDPDDHQNTTTTKNTIEPSNSKTTSIDSHCLVTDLVAKFEADKQQIINTNYNYKKKKGSPPVPPPRSSSWSSSLLSTSHLNNDDSKKIRGERGTFAQHNNSQTILTTMNVNKCVQLPTNNHNDLMPSNPIVEKQPEQNEDHERSLSNKTKLRTKPKPPPKPASLILLSSPNAHHFHSSISTNATDIISSSEVMHLNSLNDKYNNNNKLSTNEENPTSTKLQIRHHSEQPNNKIITTDNNIVDSSSLFDDNISCINNNNNSISTNSSDNYKLITNTKTTIDDNITGNTTSTTQSTVDDKVVIDARWKPMSLLHQPSSMISVEVPRLQLVTDLDQITTATMASVVTKESSSPSTVSFTNQKNKIVDSSQTTNNQINYNNKCQSYCCCCCCPESTSAGSKTSVTCNNHNNKLLGIDLTKIHHHHHHHHHHQQQQQQPKLSPPNRTKSTSTTTTTMENCSSSDLTANKDNLQQQPSSTQPTAKLITKRKTIKCSSSDVVDDAHQELVLIVEEEEVNETNCNLDVDHISPTGSGDNSSSDEGIENPAILDDEEEIDDDDEVDLLNKSNKSSVVDCSSSACHYHHHHSYSQSSHNHHSHHQHHFNHHNQLINHHYQPDSRKSPSLSFKSSRTVSPLFPNSTTVDDVHQVERFLNGTNAKHLNALQQEESLLLKEISELESEQSDISQTADSKDNEEIDEELLEFQSIEREIKLSELRKCLQIVQKQIQSYKIRVEQEQEQPTDKKTSTENLDFDSVTMATIASDLSLLNEQCQLDQAQQQVENDISSLNNKSKSTTTAMAPLAEPEMEDGISNKTETDSNVEATDVKESIRQLDLSDSDDSDSDEVTEPTTPKAENVQINKEDLVRSLDDLLHESIETRLEKVNDLTEQEQESFVVNSLKSEPTSLSLTRRTSQYDNERVHDCHMKHFGYQRNVDMLMLKSVYQKLDLDKYGSEMDGQHNIMNASSISNEMLESTTTATDSESDSIVLRQRSARFPPGENTLNLQSQDELSTHSDQPVLRKRNSAISNSSAVGGSQRPLTLYMPAPNQKINLITHLHALGHDLTSSIVTNHLLLTPYTCSGYLYKHCSSGVGKWRKRYFHFDRVRKVFVYYHDRADFEKMRHPKRGVFFDEIQDVYVDHTRINMKKFLSNSGNDTKQHLSSSSSSNQHKYGSPGAMTNPAKADGTRCVFVVSTTTFSRKFILSTYTPELMRIWMDVIFTGAQAYLQDFDDQMN